MYERLWGCGLGWHHFLMTTFPVFKFKSSRSWWVWCRQSNVLFGGNLDSYWSPQVHHQVTWCMFLSREKFSIQVMEFLSLFSTQLFPRPGSGFSWHWPLCHHCPTEGRGGHSEEDAASKGPDDLREREEGMMSQAFQARDWQKWRSMGWVWCFFSVGYLPLVA